MLVVVEHKSTFIKMCSLFYFTGVTIKKKNTIIARRCIGGIGIIN